MDATSRILLAGATVIGGTANGVHVVGAVAAGAGFSIAGGAVTATAGNAVQFDADTANNVVQFSRFFKL